MLHVGTLFSGIGAYEQALINQNIPHKLAFACEIDEAARTAYSANYEPVSFPKDVSTFDASNIYIDILVGGSPCQPFSRANNKAIGFNDNRGNLFFEYLRILNETQPKYFIYENVQGVLSHDSGYTWEIMTAAFNSINYNWGYEVLNSRDYDHAQNRPRLFVVGVRDDINQVFSFPSGVTLNHDSTDYLDTVTPTQERNNQYYHHCTKKQCEKILGSSQFIINRWNNKKPYGGVSFNPIVMQCMTAQQISSSSGNFYTDYTEGEEGFTITEEWLKASRAATSKIKELLADNETMRIRSMSAREMLRAQGFSESYKDVCKFYETSKQVGNSIAVHVLEALNAELKLV